MACGGCQQARKQFITAAKAYSPRGMVQAVATGVAINADKMRGLSSEEIDAKYGRRPAPGVSMAKPYQRTR